MRIFFLTVCLCLAVTGCWSNGETNTSVVLHGIRREALAVEPVFYDGPADVPARTFYILAYGNLIVEHNGTTANITNFTDAQRAYVSEIAREIGADAVVFSGTTRENFNAVLGNPEYLLTCPAKKMYVEQFVPPVKDTNINGTLPSLTFLYRVP